jgi:glycosyltransferase involved in cell wall biosynthesis
VPSPGPAADWLRERGATVAGLERPIASGVRALREPPGAIRRLRATPGYLREFRRFLGREAPAIVHANSLYAFAEALTAHRMGVPTLLHVHDMAPASRKARVARAICRRMEGCVAVSEACAASYAEGNWRPSVVHEAAPVPAEATSVRPRPTPFVVGTVGVISPRKGSDLFVAAAERLAGRDLEFRMIGTTADPLEREWGEAVLARATAAGIGHLRSADVEHELRHWDAFVLPSRRDPCPIALLEAMAMGLPVVGSRRDGIPEQIAPGTGLLVEPESVDALVGGIERVSSMPVAERRRMGAAARTRVESSFSLERQRDGLHSAYERVASKARKRP